MTAQRIARTHRQEENDFLRRCAHARARAANDFFGDELHLFARARPSRVVLDVVYIALQIVSVTVLVQAPVKFSFCRELKEMAAMTESSVGKENEDVREQDEWAAISVAQQLTYRGDCNLDRVGRYREAVHHCFHEILRQLVVVFAYGSGLVKREDELDRGVAHCSECTTGYEAAYE